MTVRRRLGGMLIDAVLGLPLRSTRHTMRRDMPVPMPDGVTLLGDLYRPADAAGPLPVVLIRTPYGRTGMFETMVAAPLARRGFQVFMQSTRGTFGSGGHFRLFVTEEDDGMATVNWLRSQPWCDGRVATAGGSYAGYTQWSIAPFVDPPLEAAALNITAARFTAAIYHGGAPQVENALTLTALIGRQERGGLPFFLTQPVLKARIRRGLDRVPLQASDVVVADSPVPFWRDFIVHAQPGDEFWSTFERHRVDMRRMPPVTMVTGWWDLFLPAQLADVRALREAGVPVRLLVGPWQHTEAGLGKAAMHRDIEWLDHLLRGGPAPGGAPVRIFLQHAGDWMDLEEWPPPARSVAYHLTDDARLTEEEPMTVGIDPSRFTYDPAHPTPSVGGPVLQPPGKQADNRLVEQRPDVLVFTGPPLEHDVDVVGVARARLYVQPDLQHADVFVRLCDVDPDGVSLNVVDGIRRLDPRTVPAPDVALVDGGVLAVDLDLYPTAYRVKAGHRLRVQVSGGAFPRFARNFGTPEPVGAATSGRQCHFRLFHDAHRPSHVVLPILGGV